MQQYFDKNLHNMLILFPVNWYSSRSSFHLFTTNIIMVKCLIEHKFEVAKFGRYGFGQRYSSPKMPLVYNNVALYWSIIIYPNGKPCRALVAYQSGPKKNIRVSTTFYLVKDGSRLFCGQYLFSFTCGGSSGFGYTSSTIPNNIQALVDGNFLSEPKRVLHIQVELDIPIDAFDDPNDEFPCHLTVSSHFKNDFFQDAFDAINYQVDDDDSRFEIISQNRRHFWVHKHIMIYRSPVFEAMFNTEAGPQGRMSECHDKTVHIDDVPGAALELILRYMYLGDVSRLTDQMIKPVLLFASTHFLDKLKDICEKKLLKKYHGTLCTFDEIVDMSIEAEKYGLKKLKRNCISLLVKSWIYAFDKGNSCQLNRLFPDEIGRAFLKDLFNNIDIQKKLTQ